MRSTKRGLVLAAPLFLAVLACSTDDAPPTEGSGGTGGSSETDSGSQLACGCPELDEDGSPSYPGCAGPSVCFDAVRVEDCQDIDAPGEACVQDATVTNPDVVDCVLAGLRDGTPGTYSMVANESGFFQFSRELYLDDGGLGVFIDCERVDLDLGCRGHQGALDVEQEASDCLELEAVNDRAACAWRLLELDGSVTCD